MADVENKNSIAEMMEYILDTVVNVFQEYEVSLPARQYITAVPEGEVVYDCEQLTVSFEQLYSGPPGAQDQTPARCNSPRTGVFTVELVRPCAPKATYSNNRGRTTTTLPSTDAVTTWAKNQSVDSWVLLEAGLVVGNDYLGSLADVSVGPISGGYQATILSLVVGIP